MTVICPVKTVGKVGGFHANFPAKNIASKNLVIWTIGTPGIIFVLQLKKIYAYIYVYIKEYLILNVMNKNE